MSEDHGISTIQFKVDQQLQLEGARSISEIEDVSIATEITSFDRQNDTYFLEGAILFSGFIRETQEDGSNQWSQPALDRFGTDSGAGQSGVHPLYYRLPFELRVPIAAQEGPFFNVTARVGAWNLSVSEDDQLHVKADLIIQGLSGAGGYEFRVASQQETRDALGALVDPAGSAPVDSPFVTYEHREWVLEGHSTDPQEEVIFIRDLVSQNRSDEQEVPEDQAEAPTPALDMREMTSAEQQDEEAQEPDDLAALPEQELSVQPQSIWELSQEAEQRQEAETDAVLDAEQESMPQQVMEAEEETEPELLAEAGHHEEELVEMRQEDPFGDLPQAGFPVNDAPITGSLFPENFSAEPLVQRPQHEHSDPFQELFSFAENKLTPPFVTELPIPEFGQQEPTYESTPAANELPPSAFPWQNTMPEQAAPIEQEESELQRTGGRYEMEASTWQPQETYQFAFPEATIQPISTDERTDQTLTKESSLTYSIHAALQQESSGLSFSGFAAGHPFREETEEEPIDAEESVEYESQADWPAAQETSQQTSDNVWSSFRDQSETSYTLVFRIAQENETLEEISEKFSVPVADLLRENQLTREDSYTGKVLYIPTFFKK